MTYCIYSTAQDSVASSLCVSLFTVLLSVCCRQLRSHVCLPLRTGNLSITMWPSQEEQLRKVNEALDVEGLRSVCPRCRLRLAGIKNSREQMRAESFVDEDQQCPKRPRYDSSPVCLLCLGLLQESIMGVHMEEVV